MNILFLASEAAPLYKVGGLGDVAGTLPIALHQLGQDVRLAMPKHPEIVLDENLWTVVQSFEVKYDHSLHSTKVWQGQLPNSQVTVYLFENPQYLSLPSSASDTQIDKFAFFSQAVATWVSLTDSWHPQLIHLNDWHVSLVPVLLKHQSEFQNLDIKFLLTIHNLAYQGITPSTILPKLDLDPQTCQVLSWDRQNGDIDILMEGIIHSDHVNTVSPTYAREILTHEYGAKLEPVLRSLSGRLSGILNGIDTISWNPATDSHLTATYDSTSWATGKSANKLALQTELGLPPDPTANLTAFIGRLEPIQKGVDLIISAAHDGRLTATSQFVILGTGDHRLEKSLAGISSRDPSFAAILQFDNQLSHRIYAAADFMLIPSKFEPCGLVQMIAMRYGTIPVVRKTGGLADTVTDSVTGFLFDDYDADAMVSALNRAISYCQNPDQKRTLITTCFAQDFSWDTTASEYVKLYEQLLLE